MLKNRLKLNADKTEIILFGSQLRKTELLQFLPTTILGSKVTPCETVRNLGVYFDSALTFGDHISKTSKSCFPHLRDLRRIRRHLSLPVAVALANALVSSRLDYCN